MVSDDYPTYFSDHDGTSDNDAVASAAAEEDDPSQATDEWEVITCGLLVGRYRLEDPLGLGGMAEVWRARRMDDGSLAAVKFLKPEFAADLTERARLDAEMMVAARLSHPNIVNIYDVSDADAPRPYFITEYLEGSHLARWLAEEERMRGRLDLTRAVPILRQIADALDYAHAHGVVHRDIKPGNVFLVAPGDSGIPEADSVPAAYMLPPLVKVLDFGIATVHGRDESALRREGTIVGTPDYIAPEQATGQDVDARADQYAFAVLAYRMLTGSLPFPRSPGEDHYSVALRHVQDPPPDPVSLAPDLPPFARNALCRGLSKKPQDRFPSCGAFVDALEGAEVRTPAEKEKTGWRRLIPVPRLPAPRPRLPELVVAADGSGDCRTLSEALTAAPNGATILVRPGIYREAVRIVRSVTVRADGEPGSVTLLWDEPGRPTVYVGATDHGYQVTLQGMTLMNAAPRPRGPLHTVQGGDRVALHHSNPGVPAPGLLRVLGGTVEAAYGAAAALAADTELSDCRLIGEEVGILHREGRLTFRSGDVTSRLGSGMRLTGTPGAVTLDGIRIHDCGGDGMTLEALPVTGNVLLRGCTIENCRFVGLTTELPLGEASSAASALVQVLGGRITGCRVGIEDRQDVVRVRGTVLEGNQPAPIEAV
jgi:serine/threonine-protein kinase